MSLLLVRTGSCDLGCARAETLCSKSGNVSCGERGSRDAHWGSVDGMPREGSRPSASSSLLLVSSVD
ncbi:MAG: hypothetical protein BGO98_09780 [Myxococcales bacterium 68-20]|nr:MAG: hypothetical protein BGO98_09780 [Myxococcales bacterium 68-20]